jgi:carbonic anhydrase/acetyltransferase-like protein (isoleucine patch superfamily)
MRLGLGALWLGLVVWIPLAGSVQETEALRLAAGQRLAVGREMRTWTFAPFPSPMQDWPREVQGAFVELRCEDHEFSTAALILLRDDFRLRSYPAKLLSPADRALAEQWEQRRRAGLSPKRRTEYPLVMKGYTKETADVAVSPHFAFYTGSDKEGSGKKAFTPGFLDRQKAWFETVWTHLDGLGAPMPMAKDPSPRKLNVYVTGTGLAKHKDGFAFGGADVIMHPNALGDGSSVVIHEFTHSVQYYSKGFRDSPLVGWFWECHANWSTHQFMPAYPPVLAHYAERAHYELNSSRHNYGSWPFLQVLAEDPRFGWSFPYDIWPACRRNERDGALEDPFQAIMRIGVERKVWKDGVEGFGDTIGELAARMVGWDFQNQYFQLKEIRGLEAQVGRVSSLATVLEQGADGRWVPLHSQAPKQYGVNIVWLDPQVGAKSVAADFEGLRDPTEFGDWRVTMVAVDPHGRCRYSPTVRSGRVSLDVRPKERLALAIAATPTKYVPQEFRPGFAVKRRYPYAVTLTGAECADGPLVRDFPKVAGAPHPNGGGFVAKSARVDATAFVAKTAMVLDAARVTGRARICGEAVVRQSAQVGDDAVVSGYARVGDRAQLGGHAHVGGYAKLSGKARLGGNARLQEYATLDGDGAVSGDVMIRGFGEVHLSPTTEIAGTAMFAEDLEVHFTGCKTERFDRGLFYGYLNADLLKKPKEVADNRGLYAHWKFDGSHAPIVRDLVGDADGVLLPEAGKLRRAVLAAGGRLAPPAGLRVDGHVVDSRNLAIDAKVLLPAGSLRDQSWVLSADNTEEQFSVGVSKQGAPCFFLGNATEFVYLAAPVKVPTDRWVRLSLTLKDDVAALYLDGQKVGEKPLAQRSLVELWARTAKLNPASGPVTTIGRDFPGQIAEMKITHTGELPGFDDVPKGK